MSTSPEAHFDYETPGTIAFSLHHRNEAKTLFEEARKNALSLESGMSTDDLQENMRMLYDAEQEFLHKAA